MATQERMRRLGKTLVYPKIPLYHACDAIQPGSVAYSGSSGIKSPHRLHLATSQTPLPFHHPTASASHLHPYTSIKMFTKATLFKTALVPLAAATVFSHHSAAATPTTPTQLEVRGDAPSPPTPSGGNWSNNSVECECAWDKDHIPKIVKPCKDTVWHVGERRKVVWCVILALYSRSC